uniref:DDE Tnp4 domain-containing protein n=1 Tax=Romanomermis culicivorax TaxID=13658 RepID=A0A915J722_ROMCU
MDQYIKYPTVDNLADYYNAFHGMAGFPKVSGCIDGTLVKIIAPTKYPHTFICRKGFYAINVQAVCGPKDEFTNIVAKWPGSAADSGIFNNSALCNKLESGEWKGILLGDKGYACKPYLLTPYKNPSSPSQKRYNSRLTRTRVLIEQTFGRWKRRFSFLHSGSRLDPERTCRAIVTCAILHNIAVAKRMPVFEVNQDDAPDIFNDEVFMNNENVAGLLFRDQFADHAFPV